MREHLKLIRACLMTGSISPALKSYLSKHVAQGLPEDIELKVSLRNGIMELWNLQLKPEALNGLSNLPIEFKRVYLGFVKVKIPRWSSFGQEPVEVELDWIFLLASPVTSVKGARNQRVREEEEESKHSSDESNLAWLVSTIRTLFSTWLASTIRTLVGKLKISITNVHIRFENEESNVGQFLNIDPGFYNAVTDDCSEKEVRVSLSAASFYCDRPRVIAALDLKTTITAKDEESLPPVVGVHTRFSMVGDNMELKADLNGLTVESSGVTVVEPFDASVTCLEVTGKQDIRVSTTEICTKFSFRTLQPVLRLQDNARAIFVQPRSFGSSSPQSALGLADLRTQSQPDNSTVANMEVKSIAVKVEFWNFSAKFYDDSGGLMTDPLLYLSMAPEIKATFHRDMKSTHVVIDFHDLIFNTYSKSGDREPLTDKTCDIRCKYESDPRDKIQIIHVETQRDFKVNITVANVNMMLKSYSSLMNLSKIEASSKKQKLQSVATQGATEPMQDEEERHAEAPSQMKIIVKFPKIELSIIDQKSQELVSLNLEKVEVNYATGQDEKSSRFEASVGYLQAYNRLPSTTMPVLLASERLVGEDHVIKFSATMKAESNEAVQVYLLNLDLKVTQCPWRIYFHEPLYWAIVEMQKNLNLDQLELDSEEVVQVDSRIRIEYDYISISYACCRLLLLIVSIRTLDISAVRFEVSAKSSPEQCPEEELLGNSVWKALFFQLGNIDRLLIAFKPKHFGERELQAGVSSLLEADHLKVLLWLLLCVDFPRVISSILHFLSRVLKKLSKHDHNHSNNQNVNSSLQELASNYDVIGVGDGFVIGVKHLGRSLKSGAKEAVTIIKGAQENGSAEFLQGIGKGIAVFAISTTVGALGALSVAALGTGNTLRNKLVSWKFRPINYNFERIRRPGIPIPAAEGEAAHRDGNGMSDRTMDAEEVLQLLLGSNLPGSESDLDRGGVLDSPGGENEAV